MLINTRYFGTQEVDPQTILFFPEGLPGFESCHRFKLFHEDGERPIIHYLQSLDDPDAAFSMVEPSWLGLNYELPLSRQESAVIKATQDALLVFVMLAGMQDAGEEGARIRPLVSQPVVINPQTRRGIQLLLTREDFDTVLG